MVDANRPNKQGRKLTFLDLGGWTENNYSPRKTGASEQMSNRGLGFGQIHWNINYPIPNMAVNTPMNLPYSKYRDRGGTVVKLLCYKSEDRWFDPSWCHWNSSLI